MIVIERIYGVPINDVFALKEQGTKYETISGTWDASFYSGFP